MPTHEISDTKCGILDIHDMMAEFVRERAVMPTRLDVSIETYTEIRSDPNISKYLSFHQEEPFIKICGLFVHKRYDIKRRYLKVS